MKRRQRPTQHDIARKAGVSTAVVSLVVNGRADGKVKIARETQERVRQAIRELGYTPNLVARQLVGGKTNVIGVFTYESIFPMKPNSFYQPFLVGIEEQASLSDYNLLLFTRLSADGERHIYHDGINQLQTTDGAILLGGYEDRTELARLYRDGFPFVFVGRREMEVGPIAYTAADYAGASQRLVEQLLSLGHRNINFISPLLKNESALDRERGYLTAMANAGIEPPDASIHLLEPEEITAVMLRSWLDQGATAFAAEQMPVAFRLLALAGELGLRIPDDFSLVALGKADDPTVDHHGVDTFYIPHREMGAQAVTLLKRMLTEPEAEFSRQITIPCPPAAGRTIGPVPAGAEETAR